MAAPKTATDGNVEAPDARRVAIENGAGAPDPARPQPADNLPPPHNIQNQNWDVITPQTSTGVIEGVAKTVIGPNPRGSISYIIIPRNSFYNFFNTLYDSLTNTAFEMAGYEPENMITIDEFRQVCTYLLKACLDCVFSSISGHKPAQRIALPKPFEVPTSLGKVLNDIGAFHCGTLGITICPHAWAAEVKEAHRINTLDLDHMPSFANLVRFGNRPIWNTTTVSGIDTGTAYWALSHANSHQGQ